MATRRRVGNLLALAVLSYLTQGPMHPYELGRTLRRNGDARSIKFNHGSLYMVVQQLATAGYVIAAEPSREGHRPERTTYALTDSGRAELTDWMRELVEEPQHEFPHFVAALSLIAALPPTDVVDLLERRFRRLAEELLELREHIDSTVASGVHPLFLVDEEYRLAVLTAESEFVTRFLGQITHPETGWGPMWATFHETALHERPETKQP